MADENDNFALTLSDEPEPLDANALKSIQELSDVYLKLAERIDKGEELLKELKRQLNEISASKMPELLLKHGIKNLTLDSGVSVNVKEGFNVTVNDDAKFLNFLTKRGEADIVKTILQVDRTDTEKLTELYVYLEQQEIDYNAEVKLHPATQRKYFDQLLGGELTEDSRKELIASGSLLRPQDIEEFASVYHYYSTKVKMPKSKKEL